MTDDGHQPEIYWAPPGYPPPSDAAHPSFAQPSLAQPSFAQPSMTQPSLAQPSYAQPAYPQPSYAQPAYPQPSYAQPTYPPPSYPPPGNHPWAQPNSPQPYWGQSAPPSPTRSRRKRRAWIAGGAAAALAVAGVTFNIGTSADSSTHAHRHLSVPNSFGTLVLDAERSSAATTQLRHSADSSAVLSRMSAHAVIGYYEHTDSPAGKVAFLGLDGRDLTPGYTGSSDGRQEFLDRFVDSAGLTDAATFAPGPMGGSLQCGTVRGKLAVCTWIDKDTAGMAEINSASGLDDAAQTTLELRAAAEH